MQTPVGIKIKREIARIGRDGHQLVTAIEFYHPKEKNITAPDAPKRALLLVGEQCFTWNGFKYDGRVKGLQDVQRFQGREFNRCSFELTNGDLAMTRFALNNRIQGMRVVFRVVSPTKAGTDYFITYVGRCDRPGGLGKANLKVNSTQNYVGLNQLIPSKTYATTCPLTFGKGQCLGSETLQQKSQQYQQAFAQSGAAGCDKTYAKCDFFQNTKLFQGKRYSTVSGSFQFQEKIKTKFLFFFTRTKTITHTVQYTSHQDDSSETPIPRGWGRVQIEGRPLQWVDRGSFIDALYGFLQGTISAFDNVRVRTQPFTLGSYTQHLGELGGVGSQQPDPLFAQSGFFSKLAYIGARFNGSSVESEDDAPVLTAVLKAKEIPVLDAEGKVKAIEWSDNPAYNVRSLLTDQEDGGLDPAWINDEWTRKTAAVCETIVQDKTNGEVVAINQANQVNYNTDYKFYRSTGVYDWQYIGYQNGDYTNDPYFLDPYIQWYDPYYPPAQLAPVQYLRRKYTLNLALSEAVELVHLLHKNFLPTFRGYIITGADGRLQIKSEQPVDTCYLRESVAKGERAIPVTNVLPWLLDRSGYLIVGNGTKTAEPKQVLGYRWTTAGNTVPIAIQASGSITASVSSPTLTGGNDTKPATARVTIGGSMQDQAQIVLKLDGVEIVYTANGYETTEIAAELLTAHINANPTLRQTIDASYQKGTSYLDVRYLSGWLELDRPLTGQHEAKEENIRVAYVFEDCGELGLDNIIKDSFTWNVDKGEDYNQVTSIFISAVEDFGKIKLQRRAEAHIDYIGKVNNFDLDLTGVDNYRQAAELTKSALIGYRDANLWTDWESGDGNALLLEEGDVVAVRHRSGAGALQYTPFRIRKLAFTREYKSKFSGQLYLSVQYLEDVAPTQNALQSTLTPDPNAGNNNPPPPNNTGGTGTSTGDDPRYTPCLGCVPVNLGYSPNGLDVL